MQNNILNLTVFIALTLTAVADAAKPSKKEAKESERHARILAVGDTPPFMQEVRDGVRYEIDPPADMLPPRMLVTRVDAQKEKNKDPQAVTTVPLNLNRISPPLEVPAGAGFFNFDRANEKTAPTPWLQVKRPETGDFMILLWRDPQEKTWNKAVSLIVPDGSAGTPTGTVRVINLFPLTLRIRWGDEKLILKPGNTFTRSISPGSDISFEVLSLDPEGAPRRYYSNQITQNPGERGFIAIYQADGESPRRPLKVLVFREPATPADGP